MKANARLAVAGFSLVVFAATTPGQNGSTRSVAQPAEQTIVLPLELVAGRPATLAVLAGDGHVAPNVKVVLSSGEVVTTDESGRAHFLVPPEAGLMFARIPGTEARQVADLLPKGSGAEILQSARIPPVVSLGNCFAIGGEVFEGDADRNRIEIGGRNILVLASSPVQLIVMPPANAPPGPAPLVMLEGAMEIKTKITLVDVVPANPSDAQIRRGKKTTITLRAQGTTEALDLEIRNMSPQVARFLHGIEERVRTSGGADNVAVIQLKGMSAGPFSYAVSLENTSVVANVPVARDFLEAARKIAQPGSANRVGFILKNLRGTNVDVAKIRNGLEEIANQDGSEDFQTLIRAALRALDGE
ncbi:MAG: hypothetical protein WAN10_07185 [Candidatus Acidiferrales bacterium]